MQVPEVQVDVIGTEAFRARWLSVAATLGIALGREGVGLPKASATPSCQVLSASYFGALGPLLAYVAYARKLGHLCAVDLEDLPWTRTSSAQASPSTTCTTAADHVGHGSGMTHAAANLERLALLARLTQGRLCHGPDALVLERLRQERPRAEWRTVLVSAAPDNTVVHLRSDGEVDLWQRPLLAADSGAAIRTLAVAGHALHIELSDGTALTLPLKDAERPSGLPPALDPQALGKRIRDLRKDAGLTQQELATRAGLHRPNLARVENGRHHPNSDTLTRIAAGLGVPLAALSQTSQASPFRADPGCEP